MPDNAQTVFYGTKKSVLAHALTRDDLIHVLTDYSSDAVKWLQDVFHPDLPQVERLSWHPGPKSTGGRAVHRDDYYLHAEGASRGPRGV